MKINKYHVRTEPLQINFCLGQLEKGIFCDEYTDNEKKGVIECYYTPKITMRMITI